MMKNGKRVLVTGGAGFLGSFLCDWLIEHGHEVICVDNYLTGSRANIAHLLDHERFEFQRHDVVLPMHFEVDAIFNLACPASPVQYQLDPVRTIKTSFMGAINVLELARQTGAKVMQASTSEVYGDPIVHPQTESYWGNVNPIGPRACYDEGKRIAETLFFDYHRRHGVNIRVARIFNTYGPRMHPNDGRVVSNFILRALRHEPIELYGEGLQTRSFCYVDDLIKGFDKLMAAPDEMIGPVNLGNPVETTVRELAELIVALTGSRSTFVMKDLPQDDPLKRKPDISLASRALGWSPAVPLRVGLERTIAHFEASLTQTNVQRFEDGVFQVPLPPQMPQHMQSQMPSIMEAVKS